MFEWRLVFVFFADEAVMSHDCLFSIDASWRAAWHGVACPMRRLVTGSLGHPMLSGTKM
jgi:hypothetical protein